MPPLPPLRLTVEALQQDVFPAAAGAAFILCLFLLFGRWAAAAGSAAAVVFGFIWANFSLESGIDQKTNELVWSKTFHLFPWNVEPPSGLDWLPRIALLFIIVGLLSRWLGLLISRFLPERGWWLANLLVWVPRIIAVSLASGWLVSDRVAEELPGLRAKILVCMLANWMVLDGLARVRQGAEVTLYLAISFYVAGVVMLYGQSAKFMEMGVLIGSAMFGITIASAMRTTDVSGAIPAGVAFLPGLMLSGRPVLQMQEEFTVPESSFLLVALAPVVLCPFLIPSLSRKNGRSVRVIRFLLAIAPLVAAIVIASQHGQLAIPEE